MDPEWGKMIKAYVLWLRASGKPSTTVGLRRHQLAHMARSLECSPALVTTDVLTAWMGVQPWALETRRSYRAAARGFFAWAIKSGRTATDPAADLPPVKQPIGTPKPAPDGAYVSATILADRRVLLMLRLAAEAGLRRAEVAQVHTADVRHGAGGWQLLVHGKGDKQRVVPLSDGLADLVRAGAAGHTPLATRTGFLFPGDDGGHLSPGWVGTLCSRVLPKGWSMHSLRHRFATRAYQGSRNIRAVQILLGHASVATTERYTAVDDRELREAMICAS